MISVRLNNVQSYRGKRRYGAAVHISVMALYLKWKEVHEGVEITPSRMQEAFNMFDMVIATDFAAKTLKS